MRWLRQWEGGFTFGEEFVSQADLKESVVNWDQHWCEDEASMEHVDSLPRHL